MFGRALTRAIAFYQQAISPWTPAACRYNPTCSEYARQAIERHGPVRGGWLGLRRVLRCHPLGGWGYDPVPEGAPEQGPPVSAAKVPDVAGVAGGQR